MSENDDIELLRLRAKAKYKYLQSQLQPEQPQTVPQTDQPFSGDQYFKQGQPIAGVFRGARNVLQLPGQVIEGARGLANSVIPYSGDVLSAPARAGGWLLGQGGNLLNQATDLYTQNVHGTTFDKIANASGNPAIQEGNALRKEAMPVIAGAIAGSVIPKLTSAIKTAHAPSVLESSINRGAPPRASELTRPQDIQNVAPYLKQHFQESGNAPRVTSKFGHRALTDIFYNIGDKIWSKALEQVNRHPEGVVDMSSAVKGAAEKINANEALTSAEKNSALNWLGEKASLSQIDFPKAQKMMSDLNADLQPTYNKSAPKQAAAERSSADITARRGLVDAMRQDMLGKLESLGEQNVKKLRQDYGSVANVRGAYERNITKAEVSRSMYDKLKSISLTKPITWIAPVLDQFFTKNAMAGKVLPAAGRMNVSVPDASFVQPQIRGLIGRGAIQTQPPRDISRVNVTTGFYPPKVQKMLPYRGQVSSRNNPIITQEGIGLPFSEVVNRIKSKLSVGEVPTLGERNIIRQHSELFR